MLQQVPSAPRLLPIYQPCLCATLPSLALQSKSQGSASLFKALRGPGSRDPKDCLKRWTKTADDSFAPLAQRSAQQFKDSWSVPEIGHLQGWAQTVG